MRSQRCYNTNCKFTHIRPINRHRSNENTNNRSREEITPDQITESIHNNQNNFLERFAKMEEMLKSLITEKERERAMTPKPADIPQQQQQISDQQQELQTTPKPMQAYSNPQLATTPHYSNY